MFFCVLASYYVLRPVREAVVLDGDPAFIPWLFTATFLLTLAVAPPWGAAVARWSRARLVPRVYRAFILQLLAFAALLSANVAPAILTKVFYVWVSMFNLFVVSVFWSLCADLARPGQGRRMFGLIAAGGTAGALLGPALTRVLAAHVGTAALLGCSAVLLELAVRCSGRLDAAARRLPALRDDDHAVAPPPADRPIGGAVLAGFNRLTRSWYLAAIAAYMICAACLATFVYLRQADIVKLALPARAERTAFFAEMELWTSLATLALQLLVTGRALRWLGAGVVLAALPVVQGVGVMVLVAAPTLVVTTAVTALGRATTHALSRPARELLFTAVPREDKFKAKNVIDTFIYRLGDVGSAWLVHGLALAGVAAGFVVVPLAAAWAALALTLGRAFGRRTTSSSRSTP